jgi:hypothetical protein
MSSDQMCSLIDAVILLAREDMLLDTQSKATGTSSREVGPFDFLRVELSRELGEWRIPQVR